MNQSDDMLLEAFIEAGTKLLDLPLDPAWMPAIRANLRVCLGHAASVSAFALPDEAEPAAIFRA
jgi:Protein of unknown function (DUF4089)